MIDGADDVLKVRRYIIIINFPYPSKRENAAHLLDFFLELLLLFFLLYFFHRHVKTIRTRDRSSESRTEKNLACSVDLPKLRRFTWRWVERFYTQSRANGDCIHTISGAAEEGKMRKKQQKDWEK